MGSLDSLQNLPASVFPPDFFWTPGLNYTEAIIAAPVRRPPPPVISAVGFQRVMAPFRMLRRLQKS